ADREDRLEHRLQAGVLALARQTVHLQEALVGLLLNLDQVRDGNGRLDLRKIDALAVNVLGKAIHSLNLEEETERFARRRCARAAAAAGSGSMVGIANPESLLDLHLGADLFELLLDGVRLV